MKVIEHMETYEHEQLAVYVDRNAGLRSFVAIHDTTLGPALGGCRVWPHPSEEAAITDVLRLARGMTYKNAAAGLDLGGGKGLIWADPRKDKSEAMFRAFGRFVESLGGRYITTEDVGTAPGDMLPVRQETRHVVGLPVAMGGSGDPSLATGFGIYQGIRACIKEVYHTDSVKDMAVAIQGFGKVASFLVQHLQREGARITVTDI
ncbi:MAG: Glu/Leu/Phe/Val dehydrogenase, partial [Chloroflexi bacterium]|nr:Glu/Leu/Phe/Val dehydrogenase [Chloroflexota bacterium]